jgi:hypothetical protein
MEVKIDVQRSHLFLSIWVCTPRLAIVRVMTPAFRTSSVLMRGISMDDTPSLDNKADPFKGRWNK